MSCFAPAPLFPIHQPKTRNASKGNGGVYVGRVIVLRKVEDSVDKTSFLLLAHSVVYWISCLSQYLTNLMHEICFTVSFISCLYMFRSHVLIIRRSKLHYTSSGIITLCRWPSRAENLFHNKFYFMPLHVSSTCAHHQEVKIALHILWYHHTL